MSYQNIWDFYAPTVNKGDDRKEIYSNFLNDYMLPTIIKNGSAHYTNQKATDTLISLVKYGRFIKNKSADFDAIFNEIFVNSISKGYFMQLFDHRKAPQYSFNFNNYATYISPDVIKAFDNYFTSMSFYAHANSVYSLSFYTNILTHYNMTPEEDNSYFEAYKNSVFNKNNVYLTRQVLPWFYLTQDKHHNMDASLMDAIIRSDKFSVFLETINRSRKYKQEQLFYKKLKYTFDVDERINRYIPDEYRLGIMI